MRRRLPHRDQDGQRERRQLRLPGVREALRPEGRHQQTDAGRFRQRPQELL